MSMRIVEVGPRDGLQNEQAPVSTADKVAFVNRLSDAGLQTIEATAFVSPRWVPQMADAADVLAGITRRPGVKYTALTPNLKGLERALESHVDEVAVFAAASEGFSRRNINQTIEDSLKTYSEVCAEAKRRKIPVRAYLSTAFGCPFDGEVDPAQVADLCARLMDMGAYEVAVSDTIGVAHPGQVRSLLRRVLHGLPAERIALHFHDTRGTALANTLAAIDLGIHTFDASAGGLGGCPYAPGATGNLATEDLVYMLDGLGEKTGVDLDALMRASSFIEEKIGHPLPSRVLQARRRATYSSGN
jgi:hydroxymethylglutaryl-CoA lyase